jgi:diguanylate cyclase (GGDEF)-like protein
MLDNIKDLEEQLKVTSNKQRVDILNDLSKNPIDISPDIAIAYAKEALKFSRELSYSKGEALALKNIGWIYIYLGNCNKSIYYSSLALKIFSKNSHYTEKGITLSNIGTAYGNLSDYDRALEYYFKALQYEEKFLNENEIGNCLRKIGIIYWCLEDYKNALYFCEKALPIHENTCNYAGIASVCITIGLVYIQLTEYHKALEYFNRAHKISIQNDIKDVDAAALVNIGYIYHKLNKYDKALYYYTESLNVHTYIGYKAGIATNLIYIGNLFINMNDYKTALNYLNQSLKIAQEIKIKKILSEIYLSYTNYHSIVDDCKNSFSYFKLYTESKYSMFKDDIIKNITILKNRYELEAKEKNLYRLKNVQLMKSNRSLQIANEKIKQKNKSLLDSYKKLEKLANTDYLTSLWNRMYIIQKIDDERNHFLTTNNSFVLIIADVDHFKQFNDNYGHACGDHVLVSLAKDISNMVRHTDCVARWGGEEFLFFLPNTNIEEGYKLAERIRETILNKTYNFNNNQLSVTLTFGVFEYNKEMDIDTCLDLVDSALYKGKNTTRNCIVKVTG